MRGMLCHLLVAHFDGAYTIISQVHVPTHGLAKEFWRVRQASRIFFHLLQALPPPSSQFLVPVTLCSVADSRVVPKLQPISPYPLRSAWQSASVAVVATRDCIFHYVSDSCPQPQLNASRDFILFLQRYPTKKPFSLSSSILTVISPFTALPQA